MLVSLLNDSISILYREFRLSSKLPKSLSALAFMIRSMNMSFLSVVSVSPFDVRNTVCLGLVYRQSSDFLMISFILLFAAMILHIEHIYIDIIEK